MATLVIFTVKSSGGNYSSLSAFEAAQNANLVSADEIRRAECYSFSDTTQVTIDGGTQDATRYLEILVPTAERHDGKWNTGKYRLEIANADALNILDDFVRVRGLQIQVTGATTQRSEVRFNFVNATSDNRIEECIIRGNGANSVGLGVSSSTSGVVKFGNCIMYDCTNSFFGGIRFNGTTLYVYNCTIDNCYYGVRRSAGTVTVKNTIVNAPTSASFVLDSGGWGSGTDYNASSTGTTTSGAHDRASQTFTFVDRTNKDFHLSSGDAGAKDFGTDLSADSGYAITVDVDGVTRSGTWDIGADEYVASAISKNVTDTGSGSDAVSVGARIGVTDTGAGAETSLPRASIQVAETGAGTDALLIRVLAHVSDIGACVDSLSGLGAAVSLVDVGGGADQVGVAASLTVTDAGTGLDALSILQFILKTVTDSGLGTDGASIAVRVPLTDAGHGSDATLIAALLQIVDSAGGTDVVIQFDTAVRIATISFTVARRSMRFAFARRTMNFSLQ